MITGLRVQNFRSHQDFAIDFREGVTIITGPNGSGKTSLIEAMYLALSGKSWRSNFAEINRENNSQIADWWRVDVAFANNEKRTVKFANGQKSFQIDSKTFARLPAKLKKPIVLFEPNDLQLLYGSPARRRTFFDRFASELDPEYQTNLNKFERVLRQRNNLLKSGFATPENLFVWDLQFADLSEKISRTRQQITKQINENLTEKYREIAGKSDEIDLKFMPGGPARSSEILAELKSGFTNGFVASSGAQKDDVKFLLNKKLAKSSASRGENRTLIFAILARQIEILRDRFSEVYVLLDDIDSELDDVHKNNLYKISALANNNLFATTLKFRGKCANHIKLT